MMDGLHFIKQEPHSLDEECQNDGRPVVVQIAEQQSNNTSTPLTIKMSSFKIEPGTRPSSADLYPVSSTQLSSYAFQCKNKTVVTNTKYRDILAKSPHKASKQMRKDENLVKLSKIQPNILNRHGPSSAKLPIPRITFRNASVPKRKQNHQNDVIGSLYTNNSTQTVSLFRNDHVAWNAEVPGNSFKPLPDEKVALPFFQQRISGKQRPMGSATIFSVNKPQSLSQQNSTQSSVFQQNTHQQIPVGSAAILSTNQQNLLQQNTVLQNHIQQITNHFQTASATVLSTNQQQNVFQQNSLLLRNSNQENTNQPLQIGTATILSPNQQQNLTVSQNSNQPLQMSTATILSPKQQQNLSISQNSNQPLQMSTATILSPNQQQNLTISQNSNQPLQMSTATILSPNQQQNLTISQNSNQPLKMSTATILPPKQQQNLIISQNSNQPLQIGTATILSPNQQQNLTVSQNSNQPLQIGTATVRSPNQQQNLSFSQNSNQQLQIGTATILSPNQQQNLTICQNSNRPLQIGTATILSPNQQQNLSVSQNSNRPLQIGTATILSPNQHQNLSVSQNSKQPLQMSTATILSPNQHQNLSVSQNSKQPLQIGTATILSPNQHQNLSVSQNSKQPLQMSTATILSPNQQQNLSISQNSNQPLQTSPLLSSNIFIAQTGLSNSLQQISMPTVIQQPGSALGISGYIIPTGSAFIPSSQVVQLHSLPIVNSSPVFQNVKSGIQIAQNSVPFGNLNSSSDISTSHLGLGLPRVVPITCNSAVNVSTGSESRVKYASAPLVEAQHATSLSIGTVLHETTNSNQNQTTSLPLASQNIQGNQTLTLQNKKNQPNCNQLVTPNQAADACHSNRSNVQRVVFLQGAYQCVSSKHVKTLHSEQISTLDSDVPYIETLPSGQQIIKNLNPIDMTCISGLSVPLLPKLPPLDAQDTDANTCKNQNSISSLSIPNKSFGMQTSNIPGSISCEKKIMGNTSKYSLLYCSQKEAQLNVFSNSGNQKELKPNDYWSRQCSSEVHKPSVCSRTDSSSTVLPVSSLKQAHDFKKPNVQNYQTKMLHNMYGIEGNVNIKVELDFCQATSDLQQGNTQTCSHSSMATSDDDVVTGFRKKKQCKTLPTSKTYMNEINKTKDFIYSGPCFRKRKKYENVFAIESEPKKDKREQMSLKFPSVSHHASTRYIGKQIKNIPAPCVPIQPNPKQKTDHVVDKNLVLNKIKMIKRNHQHFVNKYHKSGNMYTLERPMLPNKLTQPLKRKIRYGIPDVVSGSSKDQSVDHEDRVNDSETNMECQNIIQTTEMIKAPIVCENEMSINDDSIQIKIDSVFSLNETSDACFLASKSPYHTDSCTLLKEHKLNACFVVIEKETKSRFAALQKKVSRLRPKRACSKECRAQALQSMCHKCYFSPVLVQRLGDFDLH